LKIMPLWRPFRLACAAAHVFGALLRVWFVFPWCGPSKQRTQIANWSRATLDIFGLRTEMSIQPSGGGDACLMVANHVSWLDVFAIWSQTDTTFVAKSEVGRWPVIGSLAQRLGVIFIDRSKRSDALSVSREIASCLRQGRSVCIFPEGTSTHGREVQRFQSALFQSAVEANVAIQPIAIRYFRETGALSTEAAFTGEMSLVQSMWQLACAKSIIVDIDYLAPIASTGLGRRDLASEARAAIERRLREPAPVWPQAANVLELTDDLFAEVPSFDPAVH